MGSCCKKVVCTCGQTGISSLFASTTNSNQVATWSGDPRQLVGAFRRIWVDAMRTRNGSSAIGQNRRCRRSWVTCMSELGSWLLASWSCRAHDGQDEREARRLSRGARHEEPAAGRTRQSGQKRRRSAAQVDPDAIPSTDTSDQVCLRSVMAIGDAPYPPCPFLVLSCVEPATDSLLQGFSVPAADNSDSSNVMPLDSPPTGELQM